MNKELERLVEQTSYYAPFRYISGSIVEYDIKAANINILKKYNKISDEEYNYLNSTDKTTREIRIGMMIKEDKEIFKIIKQGIIEAKKQLVNANNIQVSDIIRIANDAIYINKSYPLEYTQFDNIIFKRSMPYNVAMKIYNIIILFKYDNNGNMNIDVKGLGDNQILHQNTMLSFIATLINTVERSNVSNGLNLISEFYLDYINYRLPIEFYREFNPSSLFKLKNSNFYLSSVSDLSNIDISYNLYIIQEIWSIIFEMYGVR